MKWIESIITTLVFFGGCKSQPPLKKEAYFWLHFEKIPRDTTGKFNGQPHWDSHHRIPLPTDTFVVYNNNDSIRMIVLGGAAGDTFRKVEIHAARWKPKPEYGNTFFFLGTYENERLDGLYFSFYATKDWSSLMQVAYTNPGNLDDVMIFSKDSVNILQQKGLIIDPKDELSEPERAR